MARKSVGVMGMLRWVRRHNREEKIRSGSKLSVRESLNDAYYVRRR